MGRSAVFARDGHRCRNCGEKEDLTIDHVIPRSRGGSDRDSNKQTLCRPCNQRKGSSMPAAGTGSLAVDDPREPKFVKQPKRRPARVCAADAGPMIQRLLDIA